MGLDQYAYSVANKNAVDDFTIAEDADKTEIAYWRKFNNLQGYMQELYIRKGGDMSNDFNCDYVRLTKEDLIELQQAVLEDSDSLKPTQGFFFGAMKELDDYDKECTLSFVAKALLEISRGNTVYYSSWW